MSEQVVTELRIDADTSGAAKYEQAMNGAAEAGQGALNSINGFWAAIGGASMVAGVAGINSFLGQVSKVNKELADLNLTARQTGLTLEKYQSYKFAANIGGVDDKELNNGLAKSASLLNDAQRNANSLSNLFNANSLSIKGTNGQLISQNQLLDTAANLVKRAASEQDKIKIAEMLGFTRQWVPFLEQGADAISRTASEAKAAGAVIDDDIIIKADEFDKAWRKSSVEWSATLKSAALSVLPYINDLIEQAGKIFSKENIKAFAKPGQDAIANAGVPNEAAFKFEITPEASQSIKDWKDGNLSLLELFKRLPTQIVTSVNPYAGPQGQPSEYDTATGFGSRYKPPVKPVVPTTAIPGKDDEGGDQYTRAIEQLEKHTARVEADTRAQGLGAAAMAEFRAEATLTTAALQAGLDPASEKVANRIQDLAQDAGDAAQALEKAKVAAAIKFQTDTAFFSPQDVQIAQQLKQLYPDVGQALQSAEAGQIRFNNYLKEAKDIAKGFAQDLVSGLMSGKSLMESLGNAASQLSSKLASGAIESLFSGNFVQAGIQGIGAVITGLFGSSQKRKQEQEAARQRELAAQQAGLERAQEFNDRAKLAGIDQSTLQGQLAAFDIQAQQQRQAEAKEGNRAIVALENALGKERQAIIDKTNKAIVKSMNDFLASVKTGANSILSPEDQLKYQQDLFASQFTAAQGGDADALNQITSTASALLDLAKSFYASSDSYTAIYRQVTESISALAANSTPLSGMAMGGLVGQYASGGMVGNGRYGIDSVLARYAGGGNIALAGGEYVTRASSVNAGTKRALDFMNRTGALPPATNAGNDNREVVRVLTDGFNGQTTRLSEKLDAVVDRIKRLEDTTRQGSNLRRVPGTKLAA